MIFTRTLALIATAAISAPLASAFVPPATTLSRNALSAQKTSSIKAGEIGIIVEADVVPERMDEFLEMIENNAKGSRQEPGCLRFDVLQSNDDPNKFFFYEVYADADAAAFHREQPHFKPWTEFKESGGVSSSVSKKMTGVFLP
eukprot:CAMPEP_0185728452 /NCGR_PEP_ID=MMETSP1171-20130828/3786_1 /TAXON_ID=374046 /ORGANISM="Helicotheca tamensis, Strain CCMP826" /LENGTH=143 /DNA_ID=CAMNT_0028397167 /DNA_START=73 /DNA_END=504 /DNA_ORIENTATION=+